MTPDPRAVRVEDFADFFAAVMKKVVGQEVKPYPWQERLVKTVLNSGWPDALDLPTGTGKTSVLLVAVFLLALESQKTMSQRKTGLRIFYVVDRRLIVDQAEQLATAAMEAIYTADENASDVLGRTKRALLNYGAEKPLDVLKLRGGLYGRLPWVREPNQPTIVLTTVDQIGARLLFRGYGVGPRQWPIHAALAAIDAIYFLDEVHLSWPFATTLEGVRRHLEHEPLVQAGVLPLRKVIMSGTLSNDQEGEYKEVFRLDENDWADGRLRKRLCAERFVRKVEKRLSVSGAEDDESAAASRGKDKEAKAVAKLLAEEAKNLLREVDGPIAVIANRVATARYVFEELKEFLASEAKDPAEEELAGKILLLTGRVRPYDRKLLNERLFSSTGLPRVLVATQTIEVGVDVSFAGMVTEAAPCDALLQRLGRLNRDGQYDGKGPLCVVVAPEEEDYKPYPYSEKDVQECLQVLSSTDRLDFSHSGLRKRAEQGKSLYFPEPKRPPDITHVELERLAQTSFVGVEPDISLYLHGDESPPLDVYVVWREDLKEEDLNPDNLKKLQEYFAYAPPMSYEMLSLPFYTVQTWLRREWADADDVEGGATEEGAHKRPFRPAYLYRSADSQGDTPLLHLKALSKEERKGARALLRPGDVVVVPASYGGVDEYGWQPPAYGTNAGRGSEPLKGADVYVAGILDGLDSFPRILYLPLTVRHLERCVADEEKKQELAALLRAHAAFLDSLSPSVRKKISLKHMSIDDVEVRRLVEGVKSLLDTLGRETNVADPCKRLASFLKGYANTVVPHPLGDVFSASEEGEGDLQPIGLLFGVPAEDYREYVRNQRSDALASVELSWGRDEVEEEETAASREIGLEEHLQAVQDQVQHYTRFLGLSSLRIPLLPGVSSQSSEIGSSVGEALKWAARYHDVGKLDPRFQSILRGGETENLSDGYLAKSNRVERNPALREQLYRRLDWPFKKRHEYISVVLLNLSWQNTALAGVSHELRELVLYLIGTHHGYGRPYFPPLAWEPGERWKSIRATLFGVEDLSLPEGVDVPEATSLESGWANRFFDHLEQYGIYGIAYLEALLRLADEWASLRG
ncbi:type I-G CRISPR-associated helicase/endonuclease Cas3g [Brockia lithotrophica]|uniref:CRISPR-associated endonuclease/helicase Cas3 n=1 Tax=Brockia lithotrophica TaxID=933949 RepID=A0A660L537_9BACL|nr:type I-U CRISPR-associated helicase/endonuclease Cas3 [Brockia lithotrophica]RKQ89036.1 CRISPR-associated endonuclease/helicase Cas3 [Brockia lithotrophica]